MNNAQGHQTALAKLLATENITVRHGNYNTAFFDLKDRILGLPIWKDKGKDVYDLLVGHEVGHALFTPIVNLDSLGLIKAYINIVEDIRIEKLIQSRYPGLIASFRRAYGVLWKDNFFGNKDKAIMEFGLADRLNIFAKVGSSTGVGFAQNEMPVVAQCMAVKTWDDVLAAVKALEDFIREEIRKKQEAAARAAKEAAEKARKEQEKAEKAEKAKQEKAKKESEKEEKSEASETDGEGDEESDDEQSSESEGGESEEGEAQQLEEQVGHNDALDESGGLDEKDEETSTSSQPADEESEDSDDEESEGSGSGESDEDEDDEDSDDAEDGEGESGESKANKAENSESDADGADSDLSNEDEVTQDGPSKEEGAPTTAKIDMPEVTTQNNFDKMAGDLVDTSIAGRTTITLQNPSQKTVNDCIVPYKQIAQIRAECEAYQTVKDAKRIEEFTDFLKETKKYVNVIAKEFEVRKAAYQYSRAKVAHTGSLNMAKVHSYKYNDDIFLRTMQMADAKSHGMMMFIDYSGSMYLTIHNVVRQLANLVLFCRQVGIPFQVYGFTDNNDKLRTPEAMEQARLARREGDICIENVVLTDLLNSKMSKVQMNQALEDMFITTATGFRTNADAMGGTPLNEVLIMAHRLVKDFQINNAVQKMNVVLLTDGEGNPMNFHTNKEYDSKRVNGANSFARKANIVLNGEKVTLEVAGLRNDNTAVLLNNLRKTTGAKILGFYIPASLDIAWKEACRFDKKTEAGNSYYYNFRKMRHRKWDAKILKSYKDTKVLLYEDKHGFDLYTIVAPGSELDIEENELEANADMTRGQLIKAFNEFSQVKKTNRVFITKFAQIVS